MKLATSTLLIGSAVAFAPSLTRRSATSLAIGREGNVELGGNTWKPDRLVLDFWYDCKCCIRCSRPRDCRSHLFFNRFCISLSFSVKFSEKMGSTVSFALLLGPTVRFHGFLIAHYFPSSFYSYPHRTLETTSPRDTIPKRRLPSQLAWVARKPRIRDAVVLSSPVWKIWALTRW